MDINNQDIEEIYIEPGNRFWPQIQKVINLPDMQYESKNGNPVKKWIYYKGIPSAPIFLVVVEFQSKDQSLINIYKKIT